MLHLFLANKLGTQFRFQKEEILKIRTNFQSGHKGRRWKMFPPWRVKSQLSTTVHCQRGPPPLCPHPPSRLPNPPHLRHPLFTEGGSTWISWSSNYLPDTNPLKKRRTMDDRGSDVSPNCFIVRKISRRVDPNCFIPGVVPVGFVLMSDPGAINCFTICQELQPGCSFAQIEHLSVIKRWKAHFDCS